MKATPLLFLVSAAVLLGGCLIGSRQFYEQKQVCTDFDLSGRYQLEDDAAWYVITRDGASGEFLLTITDALGRSRYRIVTFKSGGRRFLDICASGAQSHRSGPDGISVPSMLSRVTGGGRHVVARFESSQAALTLWTVTLDGRDRLFRQEGALKRMSPAEDIICVDESTPVLSALVSKYGESDDYFTNKVVFKRQNG